MKLAKLLYNDRIQKNTQTKFGGLNHTPAATDGEIWDMRNMTGDYYPLLSVRERRMKLMTLEEPGGIFARDKLCWVDGTGFYYDGERKGEVTPGLKRFDTMGSCIVIFPDKCYYNVETNTFGSLESKWSGTELRFTNGMLYGEEATANAIQCTGVVWADYFRQGDAVTIHGCTRLPENNKTAIIRSIDGDKLYFYEFTFKLAEENGHAETGAMRIERTVPDLKYICENENRLWGCTDSTIYASKLNDMFNWNVYDGLEDDSWAVEPTAAGAFTGCKSYKGYAVVFKRDRIYKVYGSTPSSFGVVGSASLGLAEGSAGSLAVAGETLFYLSESGIMAYSGGIPQPIGETLGHRHFRNATAGSDGLRYFVSMQDRDGKWGLYVFDTQTGLWHKEDDSHVTHFTVWDGNLYMLNSKGEVWTAGSVRSTLEGAEQEKPVPWEVEFADVTESNPNNKGLSRLQIRMDMEPDSEVFVYIQFDSDGRWQLVKELVCENGKHSYTLPLVPRRCDHFRLKICGTGGCKIYSLAWDYYSSSELRPRHRRD